MATSKEFFCFVTDCLSAAGEVTGIPMMGEYVLYYRGKVFGGIYDGRVLVKPTPAAREMLVGAPVVIPYKGAKEMLQLDVEDAELASRLLPAMYDELPAPKKRK